jgi:hypothetical protein
VRSKVAHVAACLMALLFLACGAGRASAQQCPRASSTGQDTPSPVRSLEGRLIYHDDIRQWFELRLDKPTCRQTSIQLLEPDSDPRALERFRGCRVRSSGSIVFSLTGYYSRDLNQRAERVEPVGACSRRKPFHNYATVRPDAHVRSYRVSMHVDYRPGDHPIVFHVWSAGREIRPWQAYASYMLTGGFVLYGLCGDGFVVDRVYGTPEARPFHFDDPRTPADMAAFDPESAAQAGKAVLDLGYSCVRERPERR